MVLLDTPIKEVIGLCKVPEIVKFPEVIKDVKVPTEVKEEDKKLLGKVVSFLVKNCGIDTPKIVPTFPSITEEVEPKLFIKVVLFDILIPSVLLFNEFIVETILLLLTVHPRRFS